LAPWRDPGRESKQGKEIINQSTHWVGHKRKPIRWVKPNF
jgi:hypothetical protein